MKKLFLLIAVVLFCSCSNDDNNSSENQLKGTWAWISTTPGSSISFYPQIVAQQTTLEFSDNTIKTYNNGVLVNTQTFTFQNKKSVSGGIKKMIVIKSNAVANDIDRVQSFKIVGDKLYLKDECIDCETSEYQRVNPAAF